VKPSFAVREGNTVPRQRHVQNARRRVGVINYEMNKPAIFELREDGEKIRVVKNKPREGR
jgi:hypothetical protein